MNIQDSIFEVITFYHGSDAYFETFDPLKIGTATDAGWLGVGFYFYTDLHEAELYGNVKEYSLILKNPYFATLEDNRRLAKLNSPEASKAFTDALINNGFDGVYYNEDLRGETVAFFSWQIIHLNPKR